MTCNHFVAMEENKVKALISNLQSIFENQLKTFLVLFLPLCDDMQSLCGHGVKQQCILGQCQPHWVRSAITLPRKCLGLTKSLGGRVQSKFYNIFKISKKCFVGIRSPNGALEAPYCDFWTATYMEFDIFFWIAMDVFSKQSPSVH